MAGTNPLLDDIATLMTGALGAARAAGEEAKTAAQARVRALIADMDLAGRDEVEALKAIATAALDRVDQLEARLAALEAAQGEIHRFVTPSLQKPIDNRIPSDLIGNGFVKRILSHLVQTDAEAPE